MHSGMSPGQIVKTVNNVEIQHVSEIEEIMMGMIKAGNDGVLMVETGSIDVTAMFSSVVSNVLAYAHTMRKAGMRPTNVGHVLQNTTAFAPRATAAAD